MVASPITQIKAYIKIEASHPFIAKSSFYCRSRSACFKILPDALRGKISMRS